MLLAVIAGLLFCDNLGATHLWDVDEAIFSQAAKGNVPAWRPRGPLLQRRGVSRQTAADVLVDNQRVPGSPARPSLRRSVLVGHLRNRQRLLTYRLGRLMFSPSVAFYSALILASSLNFNVIARAATPDSSFGFFSTLAVLVFVCGTAKARAISGGAERAAQCPWAGQTRSNPPWATALGYGVMGLGVLYQGTGRPRLAHGRYRPVPARYEQLRPCRESQSVGWRGPLQPSLDPFAATFSIPHFLRTVWSIRPLTAILSVLAVAGPGTLWWAIKPTGSG